MDRSRSSSSEATLSSADLSFYVHATEDEEKITRAVVEELEVPVASLKKMLVMGHHRNPILVFQARLLGEEANTFAHGVVSRLTDADKRKMVDELKRHLDEHDALYLRLSKQLLLSCQVKVSDEDPIRIRFKPKFRFDRHAVMELYAKMLRT